MYLFFEQERECETKRPPHGDIIESVDFKKVYVKKYLYVILACLQPKLVEGRLFLLVLVLFLAQRKHFLFISIEKLQELQQILQESTSS